METYPFSALTARMKYITRWSLMRAARPESLSEHTADTALLAHMLCLIATRVLGEDESEIHPEQVAAAALYHDAPEILTGDLPTPVKYQTEAMRAACKALERAGAETMARLLPGPLQAEMAGWLRGETLTGAEKALLKAADRLSALIKCLEEGAAGSHEFDAARAAQEAALHEMACPAAEYFMAHMLPCYTQNLDELTRGRLG